MKNIQAAILTLLLCFPLVSVMGQEKVSVRGKVISDLNVPVEGAIVTAAGSENATSKKDGTFQIGLANSQSEFSVWAPGFYPVTQLANGRLNVTIVMVPLTKPKYNETTILPFRIENAVSKPTSAINITKKDFTKGATSIDQALSGQVAGLKLTQASGMPGEGSYVNLRGIKSFIGVNAPLVVINGMPYIPDSRESQLLNGYSRNIFQAYNIEDIQNITVLKGAEASLYGSMGSNGVILIETENAKSDNVETNISFTGKYGVKWNNKRIPLLSGSDYNSYLSDVGLNYFDNMESFFSEFPFLNNSSSKYAYYYKHNTDWQDMIYNNGFVTDNLFRVEGGDAIAKYNLSLGYANDKGILKNTQSSRYHTQLNTNILVSKKVEVTTSVGLAYFEGDFQDQGMIPESNPVLAAYARAPILSPYDQDINGNILNTYSPYYFGKSTNMDFSVSNPLAIVNTLDGRNRQYDINIKAGITYKPFPELAINGSFGLYYNYNKEHLFIPGLTDKSILPFIDQYGVANNTVKDGVGEAINLFYSINGRYNKVFNNVHAFNLSAGVQALTTKNEFNGGIGRNTANDFYQTLGSTQAIGRYLVGYLEKWNWLNVFGHGDYTFAQKVTTSLNVALDGASSVGADATKITAYPSAGLTLLGKGWFPLSNSTLVNQFNLRAEYGLSGNSRYSSNYGKYYYTSSPYQSVSGIVRANIANTNLKPERNLQLNLGLDASLLNNRFSVTFDYYNNQASDVIFAIGKSSIYGTSSYFDNLGKIENKGVELAVQASLVRTKHFEWIVGGNIAKNKSVVKSLGTNENIITSFEDGAQLMTQVGSSPYQFYGYQSLGVFDTQEAANAAGLKNSIGNTFAAGDIHYYDKNGDHRIDDKDRVALGDATPDFFGGFYSSLRYKGFMLAAEFTYSKGNDAYNAVRRTLESQSSASNQSIAVLNRWNLEGQQTDMPRARWGDPLGNSDFSSRWIEDASYLRMKNITLSFGFDKKFFNFFRGGTLYLTGENLWTTTKYLGLDPEFSYSYSDAVQGFDYAKVMQPKAVKFGVNLKF